MRAVYCDICAPMVVPGVTEREPLRTEAESGEWVRLRPKSPVVSCDACGGEIWHDSSCFAYSVSEPDPGWWGSKFEAVK